MSDGPPAGVNQDILDDPDFKEDAVREEIIHPLLVRLGYASAGDSRIIRSKALAHPFVMIGSSQRRVRLVPDYLLSIGGKNTWVLDAKGPRENITSGNNVGQVYSYAIHPEINVRLFALCNGRAFSLFSVDSKAPLLHFRIRDLEEHWRSLHKFLAPVAFRQEVVSPKPEKRARSAFDYLAITPPPQKLHRSRNKLLSDTTACMDILRGKYGLSCSGMWRHSRAREI